MNFSRLFLLISLILVFSSAGAQFGGMGDELSEMSFSGLLPAGGAGVRYLMIPSENPGVTPPASVKAICKSSVNARLLSGLSVNLR